MSDDETDSELTVGETAARLGITVRALHHWDDVGLAGPSTRSAAGYRLYTSDDLERLRRIVVYRELGLRLDTIRALLDDPGTDAVTSLRAQRADLRVRLERLTDLDGDLTRMIDAHERGPLLDVAEQRAVFGSEWDPRWPAEARRRYGASPQWQQFAERSAARTAAQWRELAETSRELDDALAAAMRSGVLPGSPEAAALVERHRDVFSAYFPLTRSMQVCLARRYEMDPSFAAHYDALDPGLASWLRLIIDADARAHGIDPETAAWG